MHTTQRFALFVLAHAVQLEAAMSPQQQSPAVMRARSRFREQRPEAHEPRIHEQRARRRQLHDCLLEPKRIGELGSHVFEGVASARDFLEDVANTQASPVPPQDVPLLSKPADPFAQRHRRGQDAAGRIDLGQHGHVVALDVLAIAPPTSHAERAIREASTKRCKDTGSARAELPECD